MTDNENYNAEAAASSNKKIAKQVLFATLSMLVLAYASVPLYDMFCRVTGYGGTTQKADQVSDEVLDRLVTIHFDTNVAENLPWKFYPEETKMTVNVGENNLAFFWAENRSDKAVSGTATFNVTPDKSGAYFSKVQCFCFDEQRIEPGEKVRFPVSFFVDPDMDSDKNMDDVKTITLSYTFFRMKKA